MLVSKLRAYLETARRQGIPQFTCRDSAWISVFWLGFELILSVSC